MFSHIPWEPGPNPNKPIPIAGREKPIKSCIPFVPFQKIPDKLCFEEWMVVALTDRLVFLKRYVVDWDAAR